MIGLSLKTSASKKELDGDLHRAWTMRVNRM
jgi:hypothetical protein